MQEQKTILVTGATGNQGNAVVKQLLKSGFHVKALTRNPLSKKAVQLEEMGTTVIRGDFLDAPSLSYALTDTYGVFSVQNPWKCGIEAEIQQGKALASKAKEQGIQHFIYSSVGGAERSSNVPFYESKWKIEQYIRQLKLPFTIFRPTFFMENWFYYKEEIKAGKLSQPLSPTTILQQISVEDIGRFVALAFSKPEEWVGQSVEIAGDECTMEELAQLFSEASGKKVVFHQITQTEFEEHAHPFSKAMYRWFQSDGFKADIPKLRKQLPELADLKTFLKGF